MTYSNDNTFTTLSDAANYINSCTGGEGFSEDADRHEALCEAVARNHWEHGIAVGDFKDSLEAAGDMWEQAAAIEAEMDSE